MLTPRFHNICFAAAKLSVTSPIKTVNGVVRRLQNCLSLLSRSQFLRMLTVLSVLVLAFCGLRAVTAQSSTPIVDLGYAKYQGTFDATNNQTNFLSIRYAAPPVGMFSSLSSHSGINAYATQFRGHKRSHIISQATSAFRLHSLRLMSQASVYRWRMCNQPDVLKQAWAP